MKSAFDETGKTKEVIDRNYGFIDNKGAPPIKYVNSWVFNPSEGRDEAAVPAAAAGAQLSLPVEGLLLIKPGNQSLFQSKCYKYLCCWFVF